MLEAREVRPRIALEPGSFSLVCRSVSAPLEVSMGGRGQQEGVRALETSLGHRACRNHVSGAQESRPIIKTRVSEM